MDASAMMTTLLTSTMMSQSALRANPFVAMLFTLLSVVATTHIGAILAWLSRAFRLASATNASTMTMVGRIAYKNNSSLAYTVSQEMIALVQHIMIHIDAHNSAAPIGQHIMFNVKDLYTVIGTIQFPILRKPIVLADEISVMTHYIESETTNGGDTIHACTLQVDFQTKRGKTAVNVNLINAFITKCHKEWEVNRRRMTIPHSVFEFSSMRDGNDATYVRVPFDTTKNFDNLFFDDKEAVLRRLDHFEKNEAEFRRMGIPHTLGFMLHGEAGTAKTSFIKALAKHTNRHIVIVPTHAVRDVKTLKALFHSENIGAYAVPNNKRLYVFEDIDCGSWRDIVLSRDLARDLARDPPEHVIEDRTFLSVDDTKKGVTLLPPLVTIKLADLLEVLDGVIELPGRMVVMSSNYPKCIDSALLRPGRIDMVLEFRKLSRQNVLNMHRLWFRTEVPHVVAARLMDRKYTLAELGGLFALYRENLPELYRVITSNGGN